MNISPTISELKQKQNVNKLNEYRIKNFQMNYSVACCGVVHLLFFVINNLLRFLPGGCCRHSIHTFINIPDSQDNHSLVP
jgi:hypothetical protein